MSGSARSAAAPARRPWREGRLDGLLATAAGLAWSLGAGLVAGRPFAAWAYLGTALASVLGPTERPSPLAAAAVFVVFITLVFAALGRAAVAVARRADVEPSVLVFATLVCTLVLFGLADCAAVLRESRLGAGAWVQVVGSPAVALGTLAWRLYRTHPSLAHDFGQAGDH